MSKIALVTGTSSGIGMHTAVLLAQSGYTVVATMRNLAKAAPLKQEANAHAVSLDIRHLDVQDGASITACVQDVMRTYGHIDLLVNNAGSGFLGTIEETTLEDLHQVMDVNFFGVWRVTQAVFPVMRAANSGRIVTVSSVGGLIGQPFNDAYCAAKFAVEGLMESLAPVAKRVGIHVCLIEPGPVHTEFVASVREKAARSQTAAEVYAPMRKAYLAGAMQAFATIGQQGADVGRVIVEAATAEIPHFRYPTSATMSELIARKYVDPTGDAIIELTGARLP